MNRAQWWQHHACVYSQKAAPPQGAQRFGDACVFERLHPLQHQVHGGPVLRQRRPVVHEEKGEAQMPLLVTSTLAGFSSQVQHFPLVAVDKSSRHPEKEENKFVRLLWDILNLSSNPQGTVPA